MANAGLTKLQAVNHMLRAIGELPVTALDTSGSSIQARAEEILDRKSVEVQSRGWEDNTIRSKSHTPADVGGGVYKINVASDTLFVRGAGPSQHRHFTIRGDFVYDLDNGTDNFGSATAVYLDVVTLVTFADLAPRLKELIAAEAAEVFQRRERGSVTHDQYLGSEKLRTDLTASRPIPRMGDGPINPVPPMAPQSGGQN